MLEKARYCRRASETVAYVLEFLEKKPSQIRRWWKR